MWVAEHGTGHIRVHDEGCFPDAVEPDGRRKEPAACDRVVLPVWVATEEVTNSAASSVKPTSTILAVNRPARLGWPPTDANAGLVSSHLFVMIESGALTTQWSQYLGRTRTSPARSEARLQPPGTNEEPG